MNLLLMKSEIETHIYKYLQGEVANHKYDYSTFGKVAEPLMAKGVKAYFIKEHKFSEKDFVEAPDKNAFPDLKFKNIAIEFKCAKIDKGPGNDMGTLNSWPDKIKLYGDNIFYLFVAYDEIQGKVEIKKVFFDKFYKFIGKNSDNVLKYREKDGNLRPKNWNDFFTYTNYFNSLKDFEAVFEETESYRSARIVKKHIEKMSTSNLKELYKILDKKLHQND